MDKVNLGLSIKKHNNNLALLQFTASILVILSHAFPVACNQKDFLSLITNGILGLGKISVGFFFLTGGFYIAKSIENKKTAKSYFKARALRIFPPLIVVVISSIIMGSFITEYSFTEYWTSPKTWKYLGNCIFVLHHELPGVFLDNPYDNTVNGSLWTLPVEFLCYIACFLFYKLKLISKQFCISIPVVLIGIFVYKSYFDIFTLNAMIQPCLLFYIGMGFYAYRDKITISALGNVISIILFIILTIVGLGDLAMILAFPYIIMYFIFGYHQCADKLALLGKLSYGIYLCAFPIQQCFATYSTNPYINFLISTPFAILGGFLIFKYVDKPIIKLEKIKG